MPVKMTNKSVRPLYGLIIFLMMVVLGWFGLAKVGFVVVGGIFICLGSYYIYLYLREGDVPEVLRIYSRLRGQKSAVYMAVLIFFIFSGLYFLYLYRFLGGLG